MSAPHVEFVEMTGHIVDSLLLPKVLDAILSRGGRYHIERLELGERQDDASRARIEVRADSAEQLEAILADIHPHGAVPAEPSDCRTVAVGAAYLMLPCSLPSPHEAGSSSV